MQSPETPSRTRGAVPNLIGNMLFKFWRGYTQEHDKQLKFWESMTDLLKIDGKVYDHEWTSQRVDRLMLSPTEITSSTKRYIAAYGRAHLEDYCRHQGVLPDGRIVTRLPAYRADKEKLAGLGIEADVFNHEPVHESSDANLTVILPSGWTMRPADSLPDDGSPVDMLRNEHWAGVYNEADTRVVTVFYDHKPFPYGDNFRSYTHVETGNTPA